MLKKEVKMYHTKIKIDPADLDSSCQELSVRGLGFVVALMFRSWGSNPAVPSMRDNDGVLMVHEKEMLNICVNMLTG